MNYKVVIVVINKNNFVYHLNEVYLHLNKIYIKKFVFEEHLHDICNDKHRQAIIKMRISAHKLPVESGRYNKTSYENRFCTICQCQSNVK